MGLFRRGRRRSSGRARMDREVHGGVHSNVETHLVVTLGLRQRTEGAKDKLEDIWETKFCATFRLIIYLVENLFSLWGGRHVRGRRYDDFRPVDV